MNAEQVSRNLEFEELNSGTAVVRYEQTAIQIPFNLQERKDRIFFDILKNLKKEVDDLKKREKYFEAYIPKEISDEEARLELISYLKKNKKEGRGRVTVLDITSYLNIPAEQVERILEKLEKEGAVKYND